jgi:hypothetical protein
MTNPNNPAERENPVTHMENPLPPKREPEIIVRHAKQTKVEPVFNEDEIPTRRALPTLKD